MSKPVILGSDGANAPAALDLPFKPFTAEEVRAITGIPAACYDRWSGMGLLPLQHGQGATGWNYVQTFAAFVGWKYIQEGSPPDRAEATVQFVGCMDERQLGLELAAGNDFPVPQPVLGPTARCGVLVRHPNTALGRRLNLKVLLAEFREAVARVFPAG